MFVVLTYISELTVWSTSTRPKIILINKKKSVIKLPILYQLSVITYMYVEQRKTAHNTQYRKLRKKYLRDILAIHTVVLVCFKQF